MFFSYISHSSSYSFSFDRLLITSGHVDKSHAFSKEKYPCLNILYSPLSSSISLHSSISLVSNTSCRARSWLIRALVANASSPSPLCGNEWGSDAIQLWSWTLSYWWLELARGREGEMKMRRRQMKQDENLLWDVSALKSFVISERTYKTLEFIKTKSSWLWYENSPYLPAFLFLLTLSFAHDADDRLLCLMSF